MVQVFSLHDTTRSKSHKAHQAYVSSFFFSNRIFSGISIIILQTGVQPVTPGQYHMSQYHRADELSRNGQIKTIPVLICGRLRV